MVKKWLFDKLLRHFRGTSKHPNRILSMIIQLVKFHILEEKLEILKELDQSGMPISVFTRWIGISVNTLTD